MTCNFGLAMWNVRSDVKLPCQVLRIARMCYLQMYHVVILYYVCILRHAIEQKLEDPKATHLSSLVFISQASFETGLWYALFTSTRLQPETEQYLFLSPTGYEYEAKKTEPTLNATWML